MDEIKEVTSHATFYQEFTRTGKILYSIGFVFLAGAFIYWAIQLFFFFSDFHNKQILDLILAPILEFVINPFLWISVIFLKISQRHRRPESESK